MDHKAQFVALISDHHQALYRHALWMTDNPELAADLVQETYYQAWKSHRQLRYPERALAWLLSILRRNVFKEYKRREQTWPLADQAVMEAVPAAERADDLLDLVRGLKRLTLAQQDLLLRYALHGFSYKEIGRQLDMPIGTVMSRLSRARAALREALSNSRSSEPKIIPLATRRR